MPLLARQEGNWTGTFIHIDPKGKVLDEHTAELQCLFPKKGKYPFVQINKYIWADGKVQEMELPALFKNGSLNWRAPHIDGKLWQVGDGETLMAKWVHKGDTRNHLIETIHLHKFDQERTRNWIWFRNEKLFRRTLINEKRAHSF